MDHEPGIRLSERFARASESRPARLRKDATKRHQPPDSNGSSIQLDEATKLQNPRLEATDVSKASRQTKRDLRKIPTSSGDVRSKTAKVGNEVTAIIDAGLRCKPE